MPTAGRYLGISVAPALLSCRDRPDMKACAQCIQQDGAAAGTAPHDHLCLLDPGPLSPDGWRQTWQCERCAAVWLRVDTPLMDTPHRWTMFGRALMQDL